MLSLPLPILGSAIQLRGSTNTVEFGKHAHLSATCPQDRLSVVDFFHPTTVHDLPASPDQNITAHLRGVRCWNSEPVARWGLAALYDIQGPLRRFLLPVSTSPLMSRVHHTHLTALPCFIASTRVKRAQLGLDHSLRRLCHTACRKCRRLWRSRWFSIAPHRLWKPSWPLLLSHNIRGLLPRPSVSLSALERQGC